LNTIAGCEINADYHGHLQSCCQKISEIVLDALLEIFKEDNSFVMSFFGERKSAFTLN